MKKIIFYIMFMFVVFTAMSQPPEQKPKDQQPNPHRAEKIKALYVAYITQQLKLTPEDAQKFWPLHAQFEEELKIANIGNVDELARQQNILNTKKKYQASFNKILGQDRCNNFYKHDAEFRKKMLDRLKQIRQQRFNRSNNNSILRDKIGDGQP